MRLPARAFAVEQVDEQIGEVSVRQLLGSDVADQRIDFRSWSLVLQRKGGFDRLGAGVGHNFGYALRLGELLRELHDQPGNGNAAGRTQEFGLVGVLHADCGGSAHDILGVGLHVVALELSQLLLEVAHLVLQMHDIVAGDLASFGGVIVLAVGVCALAGPASRQRRVASCLALGNCQ